MASTASNFPGNVVAVTTGFAEVNGTRLYYEVAGEGHPLVLNHAGIADCRMWDEQFRFFAQHYRIIRWDARGYGRSPEPPGAYSGRGDLYGFLSHIGIARVYVIGLSMGGRIAIDFTLEHPDMVAALISVASGLSGYQSSPDPTGSQVQAALKDGETARAVELLLRRWVDGPNRAPYQVDTTVRSKVGEMCTEAFARHYPGQGTFQPLDPPAIGRLSEVRAPTLVVVGDQDVSYIVDIATRLEAGIAGARKVVIPGVAHMVNMEKPAEFNRIVLDFLKSVER